jgi:hypothetical protein
MNLRYYALAFLAVGCSGGAPQGQDDVDSGAAVEALSSDGGPFVEPDDPWDDPTASDLVDDEEAKSLDQVTSDSEADLATFDEFDKDVDEASDDEAIASVQRASLVARTKTPSCKKTIKVVFTVGTGSGAARSNGCWSVIDADGSANKAFRKCSTSNFKVTNAGAPNYAYDDTNPEHGGADQPFLHQCSEGATGDGYEYLAFRSGRWRLISAPHLRGFFAELYYSDQDVSSIWHQNGVYRNNRHLRGHRHVYPMINIGPQEPRRIAVDALSMCRSVRNHGYMSAYNADWQHGMGASDARLTALEHALNRCTRGKPKPHRANDKAVSWVGARADPGPFADTCDGKADGLYCSGSIGDFAYRCEGGVAHGGIGCPFVPALCRSGPDGKASVDANGVLQCDKP